MSFAIDVRKTQHAEELANTGMDQKISFQYVCLPENCCLVTATA
jgi:hypothetical protein